MPQPPMFSESEIRNLPVWAQLRLRGIQACDSKVSMDVKVLALPNGKTYCNPACRWMPACGMPPHDGDSPPTCSLFKVRLFKQDIYGITMYSRAVDCEACEEPNQAPDEAPAPDQPEGDSSKEKKKEFASLMHDDLAERAGEAAVNLPEKAVDKLDQLLGLGRRK